MKIFDSAKDKKWSGKNFSLTSTSSLVIHKTACFSHIINLREGEYTLKVLGKKRIGNANVKLKIFSNLEILLFEQDIIFTSSSWTEKSFTFFLNKTIGSGRIELSRDNNVFGSLEIGRVIIDLEESKVKKLKEYLKKQSKFTPIENLANTLSFMNTKKTLAIIIPYQIFGGAEIYIKEIINNFSINNIEVNLIYLQNNPLKNFITHKNVTHRIVKNIDQLSGVLISNNFSYVLFYNRADILKMLIEIKDKQKLSSRLIEVYHSDFTWAGSLSQVCTRQYLDRFITVAPSIAQHIGGVENIRKVIPVGIDCERFSMKPKNKANQNLFKNKSPILGTFARLSKEKNIPYVLELASLLPNFNFLIIGSGPEGSELRIITEDKNLKNVLFIDFQKNIEDYYDFLDAFLLTSKMEGTPISILEAMAKGLPVFATNVGAISDIIKDGVTGHFLTGILSDDAIKIKNHIHNSAIGVAAREYILEKHDIKVITKLFEELILSTDFFFSRYDIESNIILAGEFI